MLAPESQHDPTAHRRAVEASLLAAMPMLRRYALKLCRRNCDADDLVQDVVVNVLRGAHLFSFDAPDSHFTKWVVVVMRNAWKVRVRRESRMWLRDADDVAVLMQDNLYLSMGGEDAAAAQIDVAWLEFCLAALPQHEREVLFAVAIRGAKYEEAAEMLGVPVGTVKSRLFRARAALAARMGCEEG